MVIRGYSVGPLLRGTFREIMADNVPTLAASAAYNFFFSLFPLLLFLTPFLSLVSDKQGTVNFIMSQLMAALPSEAVDVLRPVLAGIVYSQSAPGLMSIGIALAMWSGSNVFGTLMGALNTAYDVSETRSWFKQQIIRIVSFGLGSLIFFGSTVVFLNGGGVVNWIGGVFNLGDVAILVWKIVQVPLSFAGLVGLAYMTFVMLPDVRQKKAHVLIGAIVTTVLWVIATLLFRAYVKNFPPNPAYGLLGAVIILLTWMYYTMVVVLVGGELASELHHGTGAIAPDKGAIYIGRIVTEGGPGTTSVDRKAG